MTDLQKGINNGGNSDSDLTDEEWLDNLHSFMVVALCIVLLLVIGVLVRFRGA